jgi:peroxiredoxin Q/BCP
MQKNARRRPIRQVSLHRSPPAGTILEMKTELQPGDPAPEFTATIIGGPFAEPQSISLSDLRGKKTVLYFYPKDDTPGCTAQACGVRDRHSDILAKGASIYGVSIDSPKSHAKFLAKHSLPFPLISDEPRSMVEAYGVWVEKSMYGKKYMGIARTTFIIDESGVIGDIIEKVNTKAHTTQILK